MKTLTDIFDAVDTALEGDLKRSDSWPDDPLHAMATVRGYCSDLDEMVIAAINHPETYSMSDIEEEAVDSIAMLCRFVFSLRQYRWEKSTQHRQQIEDDNLQNTEFP